MSHSFEDLPAAQANCREMHELISAEIDGELDRQEADRLQGHLQECHDCREVAREFRELNHLAAQPVLNLSDTARQRIFSAAQRPERRGLKWMAALALAAALLIAAFIVLSQPARPLNIDRLVDVISTLDLMNRHVRDDQETYANTLALELRAMEVELNRSNLSEADKANLASRLALLKQELNRLTRTNVNSVNPVPGEQL